MDRRSVLLALSCAVSACRSAPPDKTLFGTVTTDTPGDETGDDTGTGPTEPTIPTLKEQTWTAGPELPECSPTAGDPALVALSGVVLLTTGAVAGHVVIDRTAGTIVCAGDDCDLTGATIVCTGGVISPALIDSHDHTQYNVLAPWQTNEVYSDRYEWQSDFDYYDYRQAYDDIEGDYSCEIVKWAELRQIAGGATSVVGSFGDACIDVLARNLDEDVFGHGISGYDLSFSSGQVGYYNDFDADDRADDLAAGITDVFLDHVAEGVGGSVTDEIDHMFDIGMVGPGNVFVHATDATTSQLAAMAVTGTGIVWSPRSNLSLYDDTTRADIAFRLGVPLVVGPDWTWSGSNRASAELDCAYDWLTARGSEITDVDLWEAATVETAVLFGLQGQLGMLVPGAKADVAVFAWRDEPYRAVIESDYEDVLLVTIDGYARYGTPALVSGLEADASLCETVIACTEDRTICVAEGTTGTDADTYSILEGILSTSLAATTMPQGLEYAGVLYPLWACDEVRDSCDPREFSEGDLDGDSVPDATDPCPAAYDPDGADHDADGIGDACDACPLTPEASCTHDPDDIDDDGVPNDEDGCPYVADGGADSDGDGKADSCDACPDEPNPGDLGCPSTIRALRDPFDPNHPSIGVELTLSGVVVTGVGQYGFFVQDPDEADYGALYALGSGADVGDEVTVTGTYAEYFGLTQLEQTTVDVTGTASVPAPLVVSACDIGTGGSDAERYESMLVTVNDVAVSDTNPDDPSDFNEFEIEGCLRVDDLLCPDCWLDQPANGTIYSTLTGPLSYSFSNSKIVPRTAADLVP